MSDIIKVKFLRDGQPRGKAYTYFLKEQLAVNDLVQINSQSVGVVTEINVPEEEIADYKDKVKHVNGKYQESVENKEELS